jgi:hypothetical protein
MGADSTGGNVKNLVLSLLFGLILANRLPLEMLAHQVLASSLLGMIAFYLTLRAVDFLGGSPRD